MMETAAMKHKLKKQMLILGISLLVVVVAGLTLLSVHTSAAPAVSIQVNADDTGNSMGIIEITALFALLTLAPSILLMMTSFTRIIIILSFLRNALGTQQSPPNQVLVGLALFLTLFIMTPVIQEIQTTAYQPYQAGTITQELALERGVKPIKMFMLRQTTPKSLNLFLTISNSEVPKVENTDSLEELSKLGLEILVPAFVTSELERAFLSGFLLFLPFLIIDMVVSSVLMSMGMVMLPPAMISLPFKILMFVMVDGWELLMGVLVRGFR